MNMRHVCVAVVGPGEDAAADAIADARMVGRLLAQRGWLTLCGGRSAGVMEAAADGATTAGGVAIGVLADADHRLAASSLTVALPTGLGEARNAVLVSAADGVIGCGLNAGTASEIALALRARKPTALVRPTAEVSSFFSRLAPAAALYVAAAPAQAVGWLASRMPTSMALAGPPRLSRIVESALYVSDLSRSRTFYCDVLGGTVLLDSSRLLALAIGGQSVLLLFQRGATTEPLETPGGVVPPHGASGHQHVAFAIGARELEGWRAHLRRHEVEIESEVTWERGGTSLYVRDPDGHSIELITPGLWAIY